MVGFIKHIFKYLVSKIKYWRKCQFDFSSDVSIRCYFEGANKIYSKCIFHGSMGYGSYIGPNCQISAKIGRFTSIGPFVRTNSGAHPFISPFVTTCPMFYSTMKQ